MKKERKKSTFWQDFKAFISRGNIIDLAVGLVVGAAFTAIVNSLVNDIIKPFIALLVGGNFSELVAVLRPEEVNEAGEVIVEAITLNYGNLIMAILTFLIDAFVIFTVIRVMRNLQKKVKEGGEALKGHFSKEVKEEEAPAAEAAPEPAPAPAPATAAQEDAAVVELLTQIRDLLQKDAEEERLAPAEEAKEEK